MSALLAKKFVSLDTIFDFGLTVPVGTNLYNYEGWFVGTYVEHVQTNDLNFHTVKNEKGTKPIPTSFYGVIVTRPFPVEAIQDTINLNA